MLHFRRLEAAEKELGYRLLVDSLTWQRSKAIQLWDRPLPRTVYAARHSRGENFGLFETQAVSAAEGETLVAVVSLLARIPEVWHPSVPAPDAPWLGTLAVASHAHGRRMGHRVVEEACAFLAAEGKRILYLDCARGFLEGFYREHGFRTLAEGTLRNETASGLAAVLMARQLVRGS